MGQKSSKAKFSNYEKFDEIIDQIYGNYIIFKNEDEIHQNLLKKEFVSTTIPDSLKHKDRLVKRANQLPQKIYSVCTTNFQEIKPGFCSPTYGAMTCAFDSGAVSLESLIYKKGAIFPEEASFEFLMAISQIGMELRRSLNWFPKVQLNHVWITGGSPMVTNPYLSTDYVSLSLKVKKFEFLFLGNYFSSQQAPFLC